MNDQPTEKNFITSKMIWFNIFMLALYVLNRREEILPLAIAEPASVAAVALGNVILRCVTRVGIRFRRLRA